MRRRMASRRLIWPCRLLSHRGVLASSKSAMNTRCARVERIDDHLAVDRPRDLDAAVEKVGGNRRADPVSIANRARLGQKIGQLAGVDLGLSLRAACEQFRAAVAESALQLRRERHRFGRQDLRVFRRNAAGDLDTRAECRRAHRRLRARTWAIAVSHLQVQDPQRAFTEVRHSTRSFAAAQHPATDVPRALAPPNPQ